MVLMFSDIIKTAKAMIGVSSWAPRVSSAQYLSVHFVINRTLQSDWLTKYMVLNGSLATLMHAKQIDSMLTYDIFDVTINNNLDKHTSIFRANARRSWPHRMKALQVVIDSVVTFFTHKQSSKKLNESFIGFGFWQTWEVYGSHLFSNLLHHPLVSF